jgi:YcxB-like protein
MTAMTEPAPTLPPPLAFTYHKGEPARFRELTGLRIARVLPWNSFWIVLFAMIFIIGFAVLAAQKTELIDEFDVPPVLFTAYLAFGCGAWLFMMLFRRRQRQLSSAAEAAAAPSDLTWEATFDDAGMTWRSELRETRVAWRAVTSIESWRGCVMIWLGPTQSFYIPSRIFPDDTALQAFIAAVRARIENAAKQ